MKGRQLTLGKLKAEEGSEYTPELRAWLRAFQSEPASPTHDHGQPFALLWPPGLPTLPEEI